MVDDPKKVKPIHVFRFNYILNGEDWHTFIAGYNQEECIQYLRAISGAVHCTSISQECRLDAISDPLRLTIINSIKRKPGRPPKKKE